MNKFLSRLAQLVIDIVSFADYKLIRHIKKIVPYASASDVTKMLYDQAKLDMGFTNSGVSTICAGYPDLFISFYSIGRENFLIGDLDRKYKETMLAVWSQAFSCNYCLGMHAIFVDSLCDENIIAAIVSDRPDLIQDETVRAYALWARQIVKFREAPPLNAPFLPRYLPEILSLLVANAVYGRLANIFLRASPLRLNSTPIMQWALSILRPGIKTLVPTL
ncbi:MAG: hypothetical protein NTV34_13230, partial [Proteobacteria bacterium]|nr:hypothetical protein [Pseudomonadota bacterium]